jgi:hypothetical protein
MSRKARQGGLPSVLMMAPAMRPVGAVLLFLHLLHLLHLFLLTLKRHFILKQHESNTYMMIAVVSCLNPVLVTEMSVLVQNRAVKTEFQASWSDSPSTSSRK